MGELLNAFNAMAGAANTAIDIENKIMQTQAKYDIMNMKANLETEANAKLLELQTRNDYENWGKEINDFIVQKGDAFQKASRNQFTAKLANEMITNWSGDFYNRVQIAALGKAQDNMRVQADNTIITLMKNSSKYGQDLYNETVDVINNEESDGLKNAVQADEMRKKVAEEVASKSLNTITDDYVNKIKNGEATPDDYVNSIDTYKLDFIATGKNGEQIPVDYNNVKNNIKKNNIGMMQAAQKEYQQKNDIIIESLWARAERAYEKGNYTEAASYVSNARSKLDEFRKKPNSLESRRTETWEQKLLGMTEKISGINGSGSGSKAINDILKKSPEAFKSRWLNKDFDNAYEAANACKAYVYEEAVKKLGQDKASEYMTDNYSVFNEFANEVSKELWNTNFEGKGKYVQMFKNATKNLNAEQQAYAVGWMMDFLVSGAGERDPKEVQTALNNLSGNLTAKKLDTMMLDKNGNTKFKINDDASYAKGLFQLQDKDLVYTDTHGNEVWYGGNEAKTALNQAGGIVPETQKRVAAALGVDVEATTAKWKRTNNGTDVTNIPIVSVNGKEYEIESDGKKYKIYEVDAKNGYKKIKEIQNVQTLSKNKVKEAENKSMDFEEARYQQRVEIARNMQWKDIPKDKKGRPIMDETAWNGMSATDRVAQLQNAGYKF